MSDRPIPPNVLAAAERLDQTGTLDGLRVANVITTPRRTVYLVDGWALKYDRGTMDTEDPRWRRSTAAEAEFIRANAGVKYFPHTLLVGARVLVQERCDPNPRLYRVHGPEIRALAAAFEIRNVHGDNIGWRGNVPVFLDHDYLGPDLTVILLLKMPQGRALQGEAQFWRDLGPLYLERMVRNVRRHLPPDTRLVCMTDRPEVVPEGVDVALLGTDEPGWWSKIIAFRRDVACGRCLYLDLDNVIAGPMPELLGLTPSPLIMMDDRQMPGMANGSTMLFFAEQCRFLWDRYAADPEAMQARFAEHSWPHASDQAFITAMHGERFGTYPPFFQDLLGDGYCVNSRVELEAGAPWDKARLVFGCYTPKPHESKHPFYAKHWAA